MTLEKCGNGHLIFNTPLGKGCLKNGCIYRAPRLDQKQVKKSKAQRDLEELQGKGE